MPLRRLYEDVENTLSQKTSAILFLFMLGLLQGVATQYPEPFQTPEWAPWSLAVTFGLTVFWWYRADSDERGLGRPIWLSVMIAALPIAGVPIYLFRSRGLRSGLLALGGALLVFSGVVWSSAAAAACVAWLRWRSE